MRHRPSGAFIPQTIPPGNGGSDGPVPRSTRIGDSHRPALSRGATDDPPGSARDTGPGATPAGSPGRAPRVANPGRYDCRPDPTTATPAILGSAHGSARGTLGSLLSAASAAPGTIGFRFVG